jgi:hypothetical protein
MVWVAEHFTFVATMVGIAACAVLAFVVARDRRRGE